MTTLTMHSYNVSLGNQRDDFKRKGAEFYLTDVKHRLARKANHAGRRPATTAVGQSRWL